MTQIKFCAAIDKEKDSFLPKVVVCMLAAKGGVAMYDYMRALQVRFDRQAHGELE